MGKRLPIWSPFTRCRHKCIGILFAASCLPVFGQASLMTAEDFILRGVASHRHGDLNTAAAFLKLALTELAKDVNDPKLVNITLTELGFVRMDQGQLTDAELLLRKALAVCRTRGQDGKPARIVASGNLALVLTEEAKYTEADALTASGLEEASAVFGLKSKQYATLLAIRGSIAMGRDQFPQTIKLLERSIAIMQSEAAKSRRARSRVPEPCRRSCTGRQDEVGFRRAEACEGRVAVFPAGRPSGAPRRAEYADLHLLEKAAISEGIRGNHVASAACRKDPWSR